MSIVDHVENVKKVVSEETPVIDDKKPTKKKRRNVNKKKKQREPLAAVTDSKENSFRRSNSLESLGKYLDTWKDSENSKKKKSVEEKHAANDARRFGLAEKFALQLHSDCVAAGFKDTGKNFQMLPANYLERSRLLALYDKNLKQSLKKACETEQERIRTKVFLLRSARPNVNFKIGIISGVAGSGKSTLIRSLCSKSNALCVLANPRLKETDYKGQDKTFTLQQVLLSIVPMRADIIVVDEYTLAESAEILLLQRLLQASFLLLFGDVAQGESDNASSLEYLQLPVVYRSVTSHRLGNETAAFCKKHGLAFDSDSPVKDEIITSGYEGDTETTEKNIAFSAATVEDLHEAGVEATLVLETQGKEYDSVTLFVRDSDREAASNPHARTVAFTRHKRLLIIRAEEEILPSLLNGELNVKISANSHKYGDIKYSHADNSSSET
ncbi:beta b protein [Ligustrum mosaic virus]|nr:beta b protein [Ligustrum mosaic virus]